MSSPDINSSKLRLGVNIDHVATIRNARGGSYPDPLRAAKMAAAAGADGITADRKRTRLNSSHLGNSYAVFCLQKTTVIRT